MPYSRVVATILWVIAAFGGAALIIYLLGGWIQRGIKDSELTPSLFIPVGRQRNGGARCGPAGIHPVGLATITLAFATIIVAACAAWTLRGWILTALEARAVEPTS